MDNSTNISMELKTGPFVRLQLVVFCDTHNINLSKCQLSALTLLCMVGNAELSEYCKTLKKLEVFTNELSVRNAVDDMRDKGLIIKEGTRRKKIYVNPKIDIKREGSVNYNVTCLQ